MTLAWYYHLKGFSHHPWYIAAFLSWGIALAEYMLQVPANRVGNEVLTIPQLKMMQEVISISVFVPIAILVLKERITWDYLWAGICVLGAVYFVFREKAA